MVANEYQDAYKSLQPQLRNETQYRRGIELELVRKKLRESLGADLPRSGPQAHVQRLVTSTKDEATVALIQINQDYPFEELAAQAAERPIQGLRSGDLASVAKGAESKEFDDLVFSNDTALNEWSQPFQAASHWEIVRVLGRTDGPYDDQNLEKMKDRRYQEWLDNAKQSQDIRRDLSPQERQWAVDRASKGIFQTDDGTGRTPRR
jgi:parvulin-like peptidyl-prolyl isomerase